MDLFPSAARTATANSKDAGTQKYSGGVFFIDITAISGAGASLTISVHHKDQLTGKYSSTILSSAALTATGSTRLRVHPSLAAVANLAANDVFGDEFRLVATIAGTTPSITFSVTFDGVV